MTKRKFHNNKKCQKRGRYPLTCTQNDVGDSEDEEIEIPITNNLQKLPEPAINNIFLYLDDEMDRYNFEKLNDLNPFITGTYKSVTKNHKNTFDTRIVWENARRSTQIVVPDLTLYSNITKIVLSSFEVSLTMIAGIFTLYDDLFALPKLKTIHLINNEREAFSYFPMKRRTAVQEFIYEETLKINTFTCWIGRIIHLIRSSPDITKVTFKNIWLQPKLMSALRSLKLTEMNLINVKLGYHLNDIHLHWPQLGRLHICTDQPERVNFIQDDAIVELSLNSLTRLTKLGSFHISIHRRLPQLHKLEYDRGIEVRVEIHVMVVYMELKYCKFPILKKLSGLVLELQFDQIHVITSSENETEAILCRIKKISDMIDELNDYLEEEWIRTQRNVEYMKHTHRYTNPNKIPDGYEFDRKFCC